MKKKERHALNIAKRCHNAQPCAGFFLRFQLMNSLAAAAADFQHTVRFRDEKIEILYDIIAVIRKAFAVLGVVGRNRFEMLIDGLFARQHILIWNG